MSQSATFDVVIVGGGPAASLLAAACAARNLSVVVIAPGGLAASPHTLCAFADELPATLTAHVWPRCEVALKSDGGDRVLPLRPYARFDSKAAAAAARRGAHVVDNRVVEVSDRGAICADGSCFGGLVVDCTGLAGGLVQREAKATTKKAQAATKLATQTAFGLRIRGRDPHLAPGTAVFMDWSDPDGTDDVARAGGPSFLYALVDDDGTMLLEETALCARPAVAIDELEARLRRRLVRRRTRIDEVIAREDVVIPLDVALPVRGQRVAAFGLAAGLVHPTTGFHLATAVRLAADVAAAIDDRIDDGCVAAADAVADVCFSGERRAARDLHLFALEAAVSLRTAREASAFFEAFFADDGAASAWLAGTASAAQLRRTMLAMFTRASWPLRRRLLGSAAAFAQALPSLLRTTAPAPASASASSSSASSSTRASSTHPGMHP